MNKVLKFWPYIIILIFSLTPLLWFYQKGNILINGIDTNFPLDPQVWFQRRLFVWNANSNAGMDFSSSTAGLFFHSIQLIPYKLGLGLQEVQIFSLVFWFSLIILSSYFFAKVIMPKNFFTQLVLVSLYSFNTYLFNTWENVKVANLSLVASVPLALGSYILLKEGKISYFKAGLLFVSAGIIISGAGINPAYFISFYLTIIIFFIADLLTNLSKTSIFKTIKSITLLIVLVTIINLFWILPTTHFIFKNISPSNSISGLGFTNWVDSLSFNTSILNVIRAQGAWDWYAINDKNGEPYYIPYAPVYFYSLPFVIFSFIIPILALASFVIRSKKNNTYIVAFALMLIIGLFLGVGTHSPTGAAFRFLMEHLPFFSLFRSPWYIFTPMMVLAISVLTALFFFYLPEKLKDNKKYIISLSAIALIVANLFYSYPLVTGKVFRPGREDGFYINFPGYVFEAKQWLGEKNLDSRIIGYPDDEIEVFDWKYRGVDSVLQLLTDEEVLFSPLNTQGSPIAGLIDDFYLHLKRGELESVKAIATKLNVSMLLHKKDQKTLLLDLPEKIKGLPKTTIGAWDFYNLFPDNQLSKIYIPDQLYFSYPQAITDSNYLEIIGQKDILLDSRDTVVTDVASVDETVANAGHIIQSENSHVRDFNDFQNSNYKISKSLSFKDLSKVRFEFEVIKEGSYQPVLQRYQLESFGLDLSKAVEIRIDGNKRFLNIEKISDSYVFFETLDLKNGGHWIEIEVQGNNLAGDLWNNGKINMKTKSRSEIRLIEDGGEKIAVLRNQDDKDISYDLELYPFDTMSNYFIQVKYKHIYGPAPKVILNQIKDGEVVKRHIEQLPLSPEWDVFNFYFYPHDSNSNLRISLVANFSKENPLGTKVEYKELIVKRVFTNELMLINRPSFKNLVLSELNYKKISPVEYRGDIKGGSGKHLLVFQENYSPFWEITLYDSSGKPLAVELPHFSADFYANAWYLPEMDQNYSFRIFYSPQNLFYNGVIYTILGTIVVLLFLILGRKYVK